MMFDDVWWRLFAVGSRDSLAKRWL